MSNITGARLRHPEIPDGVAICSKCEGVNNRAPHRYCRACHAAYQRDWRAGRVYVPRDTNVSRGPGDEDLHVAGAVAILEGGQ